MLIYTNRNSSIIVCLGWQYSRGAEATGRRQTHAQLRGVLRKCEFVSYKGYNCRLMNTVRSRTFLEAQTWSPNFNDISENLQRAPSDTVIK